MQPRGMVVIVVVMIMLAVGVVHVALFAVGRVQELRLQGDDPFQVEPAAAEHRVQRHLRPHRPVDDRQGIEAAQRAPRSSAARPR